MKTTTTTGYIKWQKYAYAVFLLAGIGFILKNDFAMAMVFWALSPVFDPFDPRVAFGNRPLWQKMWLLLHITVVFALLIFEIFLRK